MSSKEFPKIPEIQILEQIGQGGYGYVYSALEPDQKNKVTTFISELEKKSGNKRNHHD